MRSDAPIGPTPGIWARRGLHSFLRSHASSFASTSLGCRFNCWYSLAYNAKSSRANVGTVSSVAVRSSSGSIFYMPLAVVVRTRQRSRGSHGRVRFCFSPACRAFRPASPLPAILRSLPARSALSGGSWPRTGPRHRRHHSCRASRTALPIVVRAASPHDRTSPAGGPNDERRRTPRWRPPLTAASERSRSFPCVAASCAKSAVPLHSHRAAERDVLTCPSQCG